MNRGVAVRPLVTQESLQREACDLETHNLSLSENLAWRHPVWGSTEGPWRACGASGEPYSFSWCYYPLLTWTSLLASP